MEYINVNNFNNIRELVERLNAQSFYTGSYDFLLSDDLTIYGFFNDESSEYGERNLFVFGKTIRPDDIIQPTSDSIFSKLKQYGMSGKYKGLLNAKGEVILPNIYDDICLFAYDRILIEKNAKFGIVDTSGKILAEPKYDQLFDAWEYTIGFVLDNRVGFMNTNCSVVIDPKFDKASAYNHFNDGIIVVSEIINGLSYQYCIDHYGLIKGEMEFIGQDDESLPPYDTHNDDEYSDPLDAYDGDPDARWNTD
ncbi:MAG: WG repeat-containing protein [Muribaculum sp.]|nr:WG repeat-containing protein [Muribaculum sp.]